MAVSKVGLGWPVGERQFDTLSAWLAALGAGAQEAHCKGDIGTGNVVINAQPSGTILIRGDIQYAGNNHTALATLTGRLELLTSAHFLEVRDIRTISSGANGGIRLLNTNRALRCYSQHTGDAGFTNGIITGQDIQNCVSRSTDGLTQFGIRCFTTGGMIMNCVSFGARRAFSGNAAGVVFTRCFGLQSVVQDFQLAGGATAVSSASQDGTGNLTGYTSAEFVNFAAADYRIKSSSMLFPLNVGAFFESGAGAVESTVSSTWPQFTVNASQVSAAPDYTSSISAQWPMLSVQASQSAAAPQYASSVTAQWPMFSASVDQLSAVPQYTLSASATWPMFNAQASQQQQLPEGATTVSVTWPLFTVSGAQASTVPEYDATAAAQWPIFAVTAAQEQSLPVGGATVAVTWPMLSVSVTQQSVAPQYSLTVAGTWPMFNVSALAGEFDYFTAPSARYVIPRLSRRATIPAQARAVTVPSLSRRIAL